MSAGLEQRGHEVAFVAVKQHGWHQLGELVPHDISVAEGLRLAHLAGLEYQLRPVWVHLGDDPGMTLASGSKAVVRRNPFDRETWDVLGLGLSDDYVLHTPEQAFAFGEHIIDAGHPLAALGSIADGRRAFAAFRLDGVTIGGTDHVDAFLNVMTSFDGSLATFVKVSYIRVVCANTFHMVLGERETPTYKVRHTGEPLGRRVDDARRSLEIGWRGLEAFQAEAERWLDRDVDRREFDRIVEQLLPVAEPHSDKHVRRVNEQREQVRAVYESSFTNTDITGSAWGVLNAWTEWVDWTSGRYPSRDARVAAQVNPGSTLDERRAFGSGEIARALGLDQPLSPNTHS